LREVKESAGWDLVSNFDEGHVFFPRYSVRSPETDEVWLLPANESIGGVVLGHGSTLQDAVNLAVMKGLEVKGDVSLNTEGILKYQGYLSEMRRLGLEW
jgi:hypothetical protein